MKKILGLAFLVASGAASAFNFTENPGTFSCPTYCTGYTTDAPGKTVDFVNVQPFGSQWRLTLSVNGQTYQGYGVPTLTNKVYNFSDVTLDAVGFGGVAESGYVIGTLNMVEQIVCYSRCRILGYDTVSGTITP